MAVAVADDFSVQKNGELDTYTNSVLANDSDADGDPLTATLVTGSGPSHAASRSIPTALHLHADFRVRGNGQLRVHRQRWCLSSNSAMVKYIQ